MPPSTPLSADRNEGRPQEQAKDASEVPQNSLVGTLKPKATLGKRLAVRAKEE